jgi:asparagine synthetase B (glutamine-hydrolysing)
MRVGLEGRVPLLGSDLVALAERAPRRQLATIGSGKRLLRELADARLPRYLRARRKRGFAVPLADLVAGPWRAPVTERLAEGSSTLVDGSAAAEALRAGTLSATDAWLLTALTAWEARLAAARLSAAAVA